MKFLLFLIGATIAAAQPRYDILLKGGHVIDAKNGINEVRDVAIAGNRIAVRFAYEFHDDSGTWFRAYGNENWEFDADGLMRRRIASINEHPIAGTARKFHWPLGRRPDDHPGLGTLGF